MHAMAHSAERQGTALPPLYDRYARIWFALGWPASSGVIGIFALMVFKPSL